MSKRLITALFFAVCAWGQPAWTQPPSAQPMSTQPALTQKFPWTQTGLRTDDDSPVLPEDSPQTGETNMIFYNNPRGLQPEPVTPPARTVSVEELQHPLSGKAVKMLRRAENFSAMGRHDRAIEQLQAALKEPSAVPYAHSLLGQEYLKINQVPVAITELEEAVKLLPHNVADHSNLGYALFLEGNLDAGEREVRQALELDRQNSKTKHVLDQILRARREIAQTEQ